MQKRTVAPEFDQKSITEFIKSTCVDLTDKEINKFIKKGEIKINGEKALVTSVVASGDVVECYISDDSKSNLDIVYEDRNFIIVNKMPCIPVAVSSAHDFEDLTDKVNAHMKEKNEYIAESGNVAYACHKICTYTGGLVLFAKSGDMFGHIYDALRQRRITFAYHAIITGALEKDSELQIQSYINENREKPQVKISKNRIPGGLPAAARIKSLGTNGEVSLVKCKPITLLRHQLRSQLDFEGYSILGDSVYENKKINRRYAAKYQALWCTEIKFYTGANNVLSYLDGKKITAEKVVFPYVEFIEKTDAFLAPSEEGKTKRQIK